jgi:nitronate monooxygenase
VQLDALAIPIVLAPLAGGPSTPQLVAAVAEAGGFAFLAAGYLTPEQLREQVAETERMSTRPFGVNVFVPGQPSAPETFAEYQQLLEALSAAEGVALGEPVFDDDRYEEKLDVLISSRLPVVSFTFGCPSPDVIASLHEAGSEAWVTVTSADEARRAEAAGADALVAQGTEAGGHRGGWVDDDRTIAGIGLLSLLQLVRAASRLPVVAAGGLVTAPAIAGALAAGARAAALGTAFLRCPEAGTSAVHRAALAAGTTPTALTRAFSGRTARGIRNRMLDTCSHVAPSAYPEVNNLTAPLRRAGRESGKADLVNLWAGQAYPLATDEPAGQLVERLAREVAALKA